MQKIIASLLIFVGVIHLLPISGALGSESLSTLYGLSFQEPNIAILMRHRSVLFGLLGLLFIFSVFRPALQPLAFIAGFTNVIAFVGIAWLVGDYNESIQRVVIADLVVMACLIVAGGLHLLSTKEGK